MASTIREPIAADALTISTSYGAAGLPEGGLSGNPSPIHSGQSLITHNRGRDYRHLPNIFFLHYADLLIDLEGGICIIVRFLEIEVPAEVWPHYNSQLWFRPNEGAWLRIDGPKTSAFLKGASDTFFTRESMVDGARV
jgi:hypothetical protein